MQRFHFISISIILKYAEHEHGENRLFCQMGKCSHVLWQNSWNLIRNNLIWKSAGFACWLCSTTINPDIGGSIQTLRKAQVSLKTRQLLTVVELNSTQFGFLQLWPCSNLNNNKNDKPSGALPLREPVSTIGRAVEKLWGKESSGEPQVSTQQLSADQCRPTLHALPQPREVTLFLLPNPQQRL